MFLRYFKTGDLLVFDVDCVELNFLLDDRHLEFRFKKDSRNFNHLTNDVIGVAPSFGSVNQDQAWKGWTKLR